MLDQEEEEAVLSRCVWSPKKIGALSGVNVRQVACGMDFSLALSSEGTVFAFGDNSLGQLGKQQPGPLSNEPDAWIVSDRDGAPLQATKASSWLIANEAFQSTVG